MSKIFEYRPFPKEDIKMANELLKKWSSLIVIKEVQIKSKGDTAKHLPVKIKHKQKPALKIH